MIQRQKEFTYVGENLNKKYKDYFFLLIGVLGSLITLLGLWMLPAHIYFVIGSSLLLLTSIYFKLTYFIALEMILIAGHGVILLNIGSVLQFALPVLLCLQLLVFYFLSSQLNNIYIVIGIVGIAMLSIGFAYENEWIFFIGSASVAIYAFFLSQQNRVSLLWVFLNTLFAVIAIVRISMAHLI